MSALGLPRARARARALTLGTCHPRCYVSLHGDRKERSVRSIFPCMLLWYVKSNVFFYYYFLINNWALEIIGFVIWNLFTKWFWR
jgi:hypothetical protein